MDALEIKEIAGLRGELDERATTQYVDGSDQALQIQLDQVESDLVDLENEVAVHETRLDGLEGRPVYNPGHTHTAGQITDFQAAVGALISAYDTQLQDGVPAAGNTLQKLYNLILGQFSEISVTTMAARDALSIVRLPTNVFVQDDGDGRWALYRATSTGQPASYVKLSDPDLLGATLSASQIKAAYESNPDTNAFTNALLAKLNGLSNYTDAQAAAAAKPYTDEQIAAVNASLANKTNNATTAVLSGRVTTLEQQLLVEELLAEKQPDWTGLTPRAALLKLINEGSAAEPIEGQPLAIPTGLTLVATSSSTIQLNWNEVPGRDRFRLRLATNANMLGGTTIYEGTNLGYLKTDLNGNTDYYAAIMAVGNGTTYLDSGYSASVLVRTPAPPPGQLPKPPLTISQPTATSAQLNWISSSNRSNSQLERATDAGFTQNVQTVYIGLDTAFTNSGLSATTVYYYRVKDLGNGSTYVDSVFSEAVATVVPNFYARFPAGTDSNSAQHGIGPTTPDLKLGSNWRIRMRYRLTSAAPGYLVNIGWGVSQLAVISGFTPGKTEIYAQGPPEVPNSGFREPLAVGTGLGQWHVVDSRYSNSMLLTQLNNEAVQERALAYSYPDGADTNPSLLIATSDPQYGSLGVEIDYVQIWHNDVQLCDYGFNSIGGGSVPDLLGRFGNISCLAGVTFIQE